MLSGYFSFLKELKFPSIFGKFNFFDVDEHHCIRQNHFKLGLDEIQILLLQNIVVKIFLLINLQLILPVEFFT
jgi:hypothetical protein